MSFIKNMYEYEKVFREIEKHSKKCVHLKCDIDFNETCLNNGVFPKYCHIYIYIYVSLCWTTVTHRYIAPWVCRLNKSQLD